MMKRLLNLLAALVLVVGLAGNAAAYTAFGEFALVTMGTTLETADSFGGNTSSYVWNINELAGTRLDNIWSIDQFNGDGYADLAIAAIGGSAYDAGYTQEIYYVGVQQGQTPTFRDTTFGGWQSGYLSAAGSHELNDFFDSNDSSSFSSGLSPIISQSGFVVSENAAILSIADILTSDYVLDIWAYDALSGEEYNTGLYVRMFAEGGAINAEIVPIPGALMLLGSGLLTLVGIRRKKA
jgi:hypothetical protein